MYTAILSEREKRNPIEINVAQTSFYVSRNISIIVTKFLTKITPKFTRNSSQLFDEQTLPLSLQTNAYVLQCEQSLCGMQLIYRQ